MTDTDIFEYCQVLFGTFPREIATPKRRLVRNFQDWLDVVNLYNGKCNVFTSVYSFAVLKREFKPMYESAIIDKVFLDLDKGDPYGSIMKLHSKLMERDILHTILFSGGGFHAYVLVEHKPLYHRKGALANFTTWIANTVDVPISEKEGIDPLPVGDIARICRVPNTYNIERKKYCIPLTEQDLQKGYEWILEKASGQAWQQDWLFGSVRLNLVEFDTEQEDEDHFDLGEIEAPTQEGLDGISDELPKDAPPCITRLLQTQELRWRQRYILILWCKEKGLTINETYRILQKHLSARKFYHCVREERQLQHLYKRDDLSFPSCKTLTREGFSQPNCPCHSKDGWDIRKLFYD